ncbi:MAG: ABC transporter ATP-binding protein/permease [Lachnospiraceae bacterium]|nr:ABC transporter ATP-binding protein/permease [Lachnospiraceae bacterium]MCI1656538.1 ABC transporter ATP-binding protein/permease [Lachnospiraceae bacterium]MCI2195020.1 ABC transporter ATP-binding protein/permease [Lachnospiraceae bacterium]
MDTSSSMAVLKKVLAVIGRYKALLAASIVMAAVSVIIQLYIPNLYGDAIDGIVAKHRVDFSLVAWYGLRIAVLMVLAALATWIMNIINNRLTFRTVRDIRARAIRQIQDLPLSYLDSHSSGDIVQRVIADIDQLSDGLLLGFTQLFSGIVTIIATLVFMFQRDIGITVLVIVMTPLSFFVARFISTRSFRMFQKQTAVRGRQTALINEMVGSEKVVKAFGHEETASEQFRKVNLELQEYSQKAVFFSSLTNPSTRAVNNVIYALVALVGAFRILGGNLTVGGLTVLLSYANQYMKPFNDISSVITELQNALACAARVFALIEAEPMSKEPDQELQVAQGSVAIEHAAFSYEKTKPLIQDFNFRAEPGMTVAIVGPTGCGKTTLINLLMRFYDVDEGKISVDGQDIYQVTRQSLRRGYGMVLQETWLKQGTVRENIAFGRPEASEEEIIQAAKEAHSWEFIRRMPEGLDTVIDDDSLSQGQKQLLCITRVMLTLPPMLILDEATSSIDTRTEIRIQEAFGKMMKGRTSFIVAHRLSTIRSADRILVMKDGRIIEQGTHEELMAANGFYTSLYNSQFAGTAS